MGLTRKNNNISKAIGFYTHVQHLPRLLSYGVLFLSTLCFGKMTDLGFFLIFFFFSRPSSNSKVKCMGRVL